MSIPDTIKGIGEKLNITSLLCNKSWIVFNEDGVKTLYIFEKDGSLIISNNGLACNSKWKYIKANKTILIEDDGISFLLHPTFINEAIFILQQDGTQQYLFLIDEENGKQLLLNSLSAITNYVKDLAPQPSPDIDREKEQKLREQKLREQIAEKFKDEIEEVTLPLKEQRKIFIYLSIVCFVLFFSLLIFIEANGILVWWAIICLLLAPILLVLAGHKENLIDSKKNEIIDREIDKRNIKQS